jgi:hypothetical protein
VYIIAGPHDEFDEASARAVLEQQRANELDEMEQKEAISLDSEAQAQSSLDAMIKQILDNVQVTIKNLHVRLENWSHSATAGSSGSGAGACGGGGGGGACGNGGSPPRPMPGPDSARGGCHAIGLTLKKLHVQTSDGQLLTERGGDGALLAPLERTIDVRSLAIYCDQVEQAVTFDLAERRAVDVFARMIEEAEDLVGSSRFGASRRHHFVLSPCHLKCTLFEYRGEPGKAERPAGAAAKGGGSGAAQQSTAAHHRIDLVVDELKVGLDEGQYAAVIDLQYALEWHKRCLRYRADAEGKVGCVRPERSPCSGQENLPAPEHARGRGKPDSSAAAAATAAPSATVMAPRTSSTAAAAEPSAGAWWRYAVACVLFDTKLGRERAGGIGEQTALNAKADRRRFVELYKFCRGRPWRPAIAFLPLPEGEEGRHRAAWRPDFARDADAAEARAGGASVVGNPMGGYAARRRSSFSPDGRASIGPAEGNGGGGGVDRHAKWAGGVAFKRRLLRNLRVQSLVAEEFKRIEGSMHTQDVVLYRKVAMLQLAFEDHQVLPLTPS